MNYLTSSSRKKLRKGWRNLKREWVRKRVEAEIIRLLDGALAPVESVSTYFYEPTPIEKSEKLVKIFKDIRDYVSKKLENIKFSDLI
jgi:hypothetical protein